jgi:ornithine cyclodeaminase/alanine dehydrogenase-like protein (mu-crystallin family)
MRVLVLSHRDVLAALRPRPCAEAMAAVLAGQARGETFMPLRSVMMPPDAPGFMGLMPGWSRGRGDGAGDGTGAFALKAVCIMPGNPARGLDAHQGLVTLFDGETGVPTAILDASAVTAVRTAAVTEGLITGVEHVRAELGEVLAGTAAGRRDAGELTMFRSLGLAVEDLAAAQCAVATATEQGIGTEVEL